MLQLGAGSIRGWLFLARIGFYRVIIGSFNRDILYEGYYNPAMLHIGFMLYSRQSAVVQAHRYNAKNISVDLGAVPVHGVLLANTVWGNIYAPEKIIMKGIHYSREKMKASPHLMIGNSEKKLIPLTHVLNEWISRPRDSWDINETDMEEAHLQSALQDLLSTSFDAQVYEQSFAKGDRFRMSLLEKLHKLSRISGTQPLSLDEICKTVGMKPRTLQKYFHELYGMGPTEYFRVRRLNGARTDLLRGVSKVSDVATHWKFTHLGRFSGSYKTLFGESPKMTRALKW
ncbi:MAG: helix-turn-helix transcriptional regulator [Deltaproteobacteria bacterium]|nr:helix-turn-helix transcriptional regulator [Deltaproteobacteria bacterium]